MDINFLFNWILSYLSSILFFIIPTVASAYIAVSIKMRQEKKAKQKAVLNAISAEVSCLLDLITDRIAQLAKTDKESAVLMTLSLSQNYFSIYEKNAAYLSVLESNQLVKDIIKTYMETKGLFDDVKGFSDHSMEIKKFIGYNKGVLSEGNNLFIYDQREYLCMIMYNRIPKVIKLLEDLNKKLRRETGVVKSEHLKVAS